MVAISVILYVVLGIVWGMHAKKRQYELYGNSRNIDTVATLNGLFWPICLIISIFRGNLFNP